MKNLFQERDKRNGQRHWVVSKLWPDRKRFRRRVDSTATGRALLARINLAVVLGTWLDLRRELTDPPPLADTIKQFADDVYMEHCRIWNKRPDFKEHALKPIKRLLGSVNLTEFQRSHADDYVKSRHEEVENATINNEIAVLRNLFAVAVDKGKLKANPLKNYRKLKVQQRVRRAMSLEEEKRLVDALLVEDHLAGVFCGLLGETGLREEELEYQEWPDIDIPRRLLRVAESKNFKTRDVPLSDYAIELLAQLPRVVGDPKVFVRVGEDRPYRSPRSVLERVRKRVGLNWVGFHSFRHYRATQWAMGGIEIPAVRDLLGHRDVKTTMGYVHYTPTHASKRIIELQRQERAAVTSVAATGTGNK